MGNIVSYRKEFGLIVVGAFLFTAAFLWKDLITDIENYYFPRDKGIASRVIFVIIVSIILVIIAVELKKVFGLSPSELPVQVDDDTVKSVQSDNNKLDVKELSNGNDMMGNDMMGNDMMGNDMMGNLDFNNMGFLNLGQ